MKKLIPLLFMLVLAGCATVQKHSLEVTGYTKPLPQYPLKAMVYYKPKVEGSQLFEMEFNQYGTEQTGYFRVAYGPIIFKKFDSAFNKMFKETERSLVADRSTRLLEAKSKNSDLVGDIELINRSFKWKDEEGLMEGYVKGMLNPFPRKIKYSATTEFGMKISFHKPDGSAIYEKTYPYSVTDAFYMQPSSPEKSLLDISNEQFSKGVDEIIGRMADDLKYSEAFIELVNARAQGKI